jgi:hypothetical protein
MHNLGLFVEFACSPILVRLIKVQSSFCLISLIAFPFKFLETVFALVVNRVNTSFQTFSISAKQICMSLQSELKLI